MRRSFPVWHWTAKIYNCVHLVWVQVQIESWNSVLGLISQRCADAAGTSQVAMTQLRQHLSHDVIWKTLQAASAGQLVKVMRTRRRAQGFTYRPMCPAAVTSFYKPAPQTCAKQMNAEYGKTKKKKKSQSTRGEQQDTQ